MADIKISQLGAAASVNNNDVVPMVANGVTVKASASLLKGYIIGSTDISSIGDGTPTGAISALNAKNGGANISDIGDGTITGAISALDTMDGNANISGIGDGSITGSIVALNTSKQAKTLDTPITVAGQSLTTVEGALNGLDVQAANKVLYLKNVACNATTGNFTSYSNSAITANHVVSECVFENPSAITTDVTWTTENGSVTLNGTCTTATTVNLILVKKDN